VGIDEQAEARVELVAGNVDIADPVGIDVGHEGVQIRSPVVLVIDRNVVEVKKHLAVRLIEHFAQELDLGHVADVRVPGAVLHGDAPA
jgi:hypothetical protein